MHKWKPDVNAGWEFCTCLNRCGWFRVTTVIAGRDLVEYVKGEITQDFQPMCILPEIEDILT